RLSSLRLDARLPIYTPLDEIWVGSDRVDGLPFHSGWQQPVMIRDGSIYLAMRPLQPVNLGGAEPALEIAEANNHLIVSIYNLRDSEPRMFPAFMLDHTHNGVIFEIGSSSEYGNFSAFRHHIDLATATETLWLSEIREV